MPLLRVLCRQDKAGRSGEGFPLWGAVGAKAGKRGAQQAAQGDRGTELGVGRGQEVRWRHI